MRWPPSGEMIPQWIFHGKTIQRKRANGLSQFARPDRHRPIFRALEKVGGKAEELTWEIYRRP